jgi:hypothetical protein
MTDWRVILAVGVIVAFGAQYLRQHWILTPVRVILFWAGMLLIINALFMWFAGDMIQDELNSLKGVIDENRNN